MVKVEYIPIRKIVILEVIRNKTPEELATAIAPAKMAGQQVILKWADGVIFNFNGLPPSTDKLMDEFTKGIVYWQSVSYSLMPKYKPLITVSSDIGGTAEIGVMDVSMNQTLVKVASWLKDFSTKSST